MVKSICRWQVSNTPDLAYAKIYANLAQFLKQCRASFQYSLPCGFKISREPWVCHFTGMIRMRHQQRDFMLWVSADKPQDVAQIAFIHANQMIIPCIIQPGHLPVETLTEEGLLTKKECSLADFGSDEGYIAYDKLYENRFPLLRKAFGRWRAKQGEGRTLEKELRPETREYCFYMAVKNYFKGKSWNLWDEDIRLRRPDAVERYEKLLEEEVLFYQFLQYKFQEQWKKLKAYANEKGIRIIGDIPIYVAFDSADAWMHPELFQFDEENLPSAVAGCPPDDFSADGQLWGNPLYRWDYHEKTGFAWWMGRMEYSLQLYDVVRVDHFRGFDEYYSIPYGSRTAQKGTWEKGPGIAIFQEMKKHFGTEDLPIIAEDLGFLTPSVLKLVEDTGFPGMKVLEFAFEAGKDSEYHEVRPAIRLFR